MKRIKRLYLLLINEFPNIWESSKYEHVDVLWNMTNSLKQHIKKRDTLKKVLVEQEKAGVKVVRRN